MNHKLKIWPKYYAEVSKRNKNFEIRKNDRNFKEGDTVTLQEFDPEKNQHTGNELSFKIDYVLPLADFFCNDNPYVVFGMSEI